MSKRASALIILFVAVAAIFGWSESNAQSRNENPDVVEQNQSVRTTVPQKAEGYTTARTYTGVISASRTSELSFLRSGRLQQVLVREGDRVVKGQLLARLDTRDLMAQRSQLYAQRDRAQARLSELRRGPRVEPRLGAQAQVERLKADLALDQVKLRRREELFAKGAIPAENLDELRARVAVTKANLETARQNSLELDNGTRPEVILQGQADLREIDAGLQALAVRFEDSELRAPFSGKIALRLLDEGTILGPGTAVFTLDENGPKEGIVDLPADITPPIEAEFVLQGVKAKGSLIASPTRVDQNSFTQKARYRLTDGKPGEPITLNMEEFVEEPGLWLPTLSLTSAGNGLWQCYTVGPKETVQVQQVEILHRADERVLVRGTLRANHRIIIDGVQSVVPGQEVAIIP